MPHILVHLETLPFYSIHTQNKLLEIHQANGSSKEVIFTHCFYTMKFHIRVLPSHFFILCNQFSLSDTSVDLFVIQY